MLTLTCSFQAYTSCLIILHAAMQKLLHNWESTTWQDDLAKARLCLHVIKYCASSDAIAHRFRLELEQFYNYIAKQEGNNSHDDDFLTAQPDPREKISVGGNGYLESEPNDSSYLTSIPPGANPEHLQQSCHILVKLCQPFGDPKHEGLGLDEVQERWQCEPSCGLPTLMMARLDWDLETRQPFRWDAKKLTAHSVGQGTVVELSHGDHTPSEQATSVLASSLEGRFLGSTAPSVWKAWSGAIDVPSHPARVQQVSVEEMILD
jgi:hypothetical protein